MEKKKKGVNHTQLRPSHIEYFVLPCPSALEGNVPSPTPSPRGCSQRLGAEQGARPSPVRVGCLGPLPGNCRFRVRFPKPPAQHLHKQALSKRQVKRSFQLRATVQGTSFEATQTRVQVKPGFADLLSNCRPTSPVRARASSFVKWMTVPTSECCQDYPW